MPGATTHFPLHQVCLLPVLRLEASSKGRFSLGFIFAGIVIAESLFNPF